MSKYYIIPVFVPHFGCPHDCVFCNQKKITGLSTTVTPQEVREIIEEHLKYFSQDSFIEVAFYGGSFTAIDVDIQKQLLEIPSMYKREGKINEIRLSTRPDAINEDILDVLRDYGVNTIELGVQSFDDEVLSKSDRGHTVSDVYKASKLIKEYGLNLGLQMMVGLPGDTFEKSLNTCLEFIKLKPYCVRIYPTLIIRQTLLENMFLNNEYTPLTIEEAVDISSVLLMLFTINDINVIRVGLQPTENIQLGKDVIGGPFHPAFRQLVESSIFVKLFDYYLLKNKIYTKGKNLIIECSNRNVSHIAGQNSKNKEYFKDRYGFRKINIYGKNMDSDYIFITIDDFYDKINMKLLMESYLLENPLIKAKIKGFQ